MQKFQTEIAKLKSVRAEVLENLAQLGPHEQGGEVWRRLQEEGARLDQEIAALERVAEDR